MKRGTLIALALCILAALIGGAGLWHTAYIVADTTPPEIREVFPEGEVSAAMALDEEGHLIAKAWIYENMELDHVTASVYKKTLLGWSKLEAISLTLKEELAGDVYLYTGVFTGSSPEEGDGGGGGGGGAPPPGGEEPLISWVIRYGKKYKLKIEAVDKAGNEDSYECTFTIAESSPIDGYVTVNGERVSGPDDTIYVNSLSLTIKVYITKGEDQLDRLELQLYGDFLSNFTKRGDHWETTYRLPREGRYSFQVYAYDKLANSYQLASFAVALENRMKWLTLLGAAAVLGLVAAYGYLGRRGDRRGR